MERKVGSLVGALAPMLALSSSDAGTGAGTYIRYLMNIELYSLNIHLLSRDSSRIALVALIYINKVINSRLLSWEAYVIRPASRALLLIIRLVADAWPITKPFSSQL